MRAGPRERAHRYRDEPTMILQVWPSWRDLRTESMVREFRSLISGLAAPGWPRRLRPSSALAIASRVAAVCLEARGGHAMSSTPSRNRTAAIESWRQVHLQGVVSLATSSLITGTFGAYAEGLGLLLATVDSKLLCPTEDRDPPYRPRS